MSNHTLEEEDGLTQPNSVDLFDPRNELMREIKHIDQLILNTRQGEPLPNEVAKIKQILPDLIGLLREHPQVPIKPTANIGGKTPLNLDLLGMYNFLELKVAEALRLDPERFTSESQQARELAINTIATLKSPLNEVDMIGSQQRFPFEIIEETVNGFNIRDIITATAYGQKLAALAIDLDMTNIPSYHDYMQQLAVFFT